MSGQHKPVSKHAAPRGGGWVFGLGIPFAFWSMLTAFVAAMGIAPLGDSTPALVLVVAFLTRRWRGVATRWLTVASVLAGVMALQWIPWYSWMISQRWPGNDLLSTVSMIYAVELLVLVVLFTIASVLSIRGIRRARAAAPESAPIDALSIES